MFPLCDKRSTKSKHREGRQSEQATNNELASKDQMLKASIKRLLKELTRLDIMKMLAGKSMHQTEATQQLGTSVRQVNRKFRDYRVIAD